VNEPRERVSNPRENWSEELAAALSALESLVGPPVGSNSRLKRNLARLRTAIQQMGRQDERAFFVRLESLSVAHSERPSSRIPAFEQLRHVSLEEVEERLRDPAVSKGELLAIVRGRFQSSTGSLSRLSKRQIVERIETLVMNERGHGSISRLAQGHPASHPTSASSRTEAADSARPDGAIRLPSED